MKNRSHDDAVTNQFQWVRLPARAVVSRLNTACSRTETVPDFEQMADVDAYYRGRGAYIDDM